MPTAEPTSGHLLSDVARLVRKYFEQQARIRKLGLTRSQAAVLSLLSRYEGINQVTLAQLMEIEPITLVRLLDRLQAAHLVERRPDPHDRRVRILYLTPEARPLLAEVSELGASVFADAQAGLSEAQRQAFWETLKIMKGNLIENMSRDMPSDERREVVNG